MKPKAIVTGALLLFVAASVVALIVRENRTPATPPAAPTTNKIIAYYFHGNVRCATCRKIEALAQQSITNNFADALDAGRLEWRVVNVDEPGNEHFVKDFELSTRSVVVVDMRDGKPARWNVLGKVWELVGHEAQFADYIRDEVRAYLQ